MSFQTVDEIEDVVRAGANPSVRSLYNIWEQRLPVAIATKGNKAVTSGSLSSVNQIRWIQCDLALVTAFTEQALKKEEFLLVCDAYREANVYWQKQEDADPGELLKLHSHYATAKTRLGFTQEARLGLEPLVEDARLGRKERARIFLQLGEILREESHHTSGQSARIQTAENAQKFYQNALALDSSLLEAWVLNAAMALIVSEKGSARRQQAEELGRQVLELIEKLETSKGESFRSAWYKAVAYSVLGRVDEAAGIYGKLQAFPDVTTSDLAEVRYRSQFLAEALGEPRDFFKKVFPPLQLIVFTGHIPDLPGRPERFPAEAIPMVLEMLGKKLDEMQARVGLVSAAAGADLLFIKALSERPGAKYHMILPWSQKEFYRTSVEPFEPAGAPPIWMPLFDKALEDAATVRELGQVFEPGDDVGWEYTQEVTAGLALLTARVSRLDVQPMALWDGNAGKGAGGTASFVEFWSHYLEQPPIILDLPAKGDSPKRSRRMGEFRSERDSMHQEVKSMLFADIVGYSKLPEKVIRDFVLVFLQQLSNLVAQSPNAPRNINTWGDAVYAVFDFAEDAGRFALQLTQMIRDGEKEWLEKGLLFEEHDVEEGKMVPRPLNIRVGLHTGPVFAHYNPVLRQLGFTGSHVSRAARIEPVAAAGEVYASEEFAAMAELGNQIRRTRRSSKGSRANEGDGFVCEYAGTMPLAKNYPGRFRIYRVIPHRMLAMEELAMAAHAIHAEEQMKRGKTPQDTPSIRAWNGLSEDLRDECRAQAADLPNKLFFLGFDLVPSHGISPWEIKISPEQIEELAKREHDRWMAERQRQGWEFGSDHCNARKHDPCLIPWNELKDEDKQTDRDKISQIPKVIERAGFRVRKIARAG